MKQLTLLKSEFKSYGGALFNTRKGRSRGRPLATKNSMHLVLRSSQAIGPWGFRYKSNQEKVKAVLQKFAVKYGVRLLSFANVGNHIHIHMQLGNRAGYKPFIRAITSAIMMTITGVNRWTSNTLKKKFWDLRPFTRIVIGRNAILRLKDYIEINRLQGFGHTCGSARFYMEWDKTVTQV